MNAQDDDLEYMIEELKTLLQCEIEKVPTDMIDESYKARNIANYSNAIRALKDIEKK